MAGDRVLAIGLMSGTSLDGIDAALIETDGEDFVRPVAFRCEPYSDAERAQLMAVTALALTYDRPRQSPEIVAATELLDRAHVLAVDALLREAGLAADRVRVIGYHGQTVAHRPERGWTWQIGSGAVMAAATGIDVVDDLRSADVAAGGQGAPLLPIYHGALVAGLETPVAVLNVGGVANVTYVGDDGRLVAFDTGPGNGLIDSWVEAHAGERFDRDGALAALGRVDGRVLEAMLDQPYFAASLPKSLDRNDFTIAPCAGLSLEDGAATLTAFTAETIARAMDLLPRRPAALIVVGGGARNPTLMRAVAKVADIDTITGESLGWRGDAIEAEGFAYLAVRSLRGLPLTFPGTTGVPVPITGGVLHPAA